ncbi:uncharacterized protein LOC112596386 [Melanaphis sacchari]|uniref:uncharacterized protein LOC112596386 n=1 Tax=Melanaphis sacchari TaxID=742174 RepID=UPI000DC13BAD|nr:uncharacterized protein LOC112596386 [Melanaphis sacchari]
MYVHLFNSIVNCIYLLHYIIVLRYDDNNRVVQSSGKGNADFTDDRTFCRRIEVCCRVVAAAVVCAVQQLKYECSALKNFLSLPFHQLPAHNTCFNTYTNDPLPFDFLQKRRKMI